MKKISLLILCFVSIAAFAQKKNKTAELFSKTITANELKTHLYILAAPDMEGEKPELQGNEKLLNT